MRSEGTVVGSVSLSVCLSVCLLLYISHKWLILNHYLDTCTTCVYALLKCWVFSFSTLGAHAQRRLVVVLYYCVSACLSVTSHFSSVRSSHKGYDLLKKGNEGKNFFSENAPLQN